jgi:hemoglobin/transferrin/lactoferrin receptor protein
MRTFLLSSAATFAVLSAGAAVAQPYAGDDQPDDLGEITITATRTVQQVDEVPATVSVMTEREIEDNLVDDIKDLVRWEPGVEVPTSPARFGAALGASGRDGNSGFNIRGLEGNRVLIQTDGVRVPDAYAFGPSLYGRGDFVDMDLLSRVEIVRGPTSPPYGSDGLAGAVSFVTRDPAEFLSNGRDFGLRARSAYASANDQWTNGLILAGRAGRFSGLLSYTRRDGHEQENQGDNDIVGSLRDTANPQDVESNAYMARGVYQVNEQHRLRLTWDHLDREVSSDILSGVTASTLDILGTDTTDRDRVAADWIFEDGTGLIQDAQITAYWQDADVRQFTFEDRNPAADRTRDNTFDNEVFGASAQFDSVVSLGSVEHRFTWGADYSMTRQEGIRTGTVPPFGETFPNRAFPNTDYALAGAFVQDEIALMGGSLTLFPAVRLDWYDLSPEVDALYAYPAEGSSDSHVSPKFGAMWWFSDHLGLFANIAMGFKAPAPSQVNNGFSNLAFGYVSLPNPDLQPETSRTVEVGLRFRDFVDGAGGRWSAGITAYHGEYDDFILQEVVSGSFTPIDPAVYQYINVDSATVSGVEARAQGRWDSGWGVNMALSFQSGEQERAGVALDLPTANPVKFTGGASYDDPAGRFGGQLIATVTGDMDTDGMGLACGTACFGGGRTQVLDATAYWNVTEAVALRAGVFNLTDETWWNWSDVRGVNRLSSVLDAYSQPGRNFAVSLTYRY